MSVARLAAHPLVVAVALGLLGPHALETDLDGRRSGSEDAEPASPTGAAREIPPVRDITPEEMARAEAAWLAAREQIG